MTVMASRSSTTASVSRKVRNAVGKWVDSTASTASANAMSVAMGTAHPSRFSGWPASTLMARKIPAGTIIPPVAGDKLAFELESDHEEEDGQRPVGSPGRQVEVQVKFLRAYRELRDGAVG